MKLRFTLTVLTLIISLNSFAQSWLREMNKENPNFYSIKAKAERYFRDEIREMRYESKRKKIKEEQKDEDEGADGYHIYKRWEEFWQPRVNADGSFPAPDAAYRNFLEWKEQNSSSKFMSQGTWAPLGPFTAVTGPGQTSGVGRVNGLAVNPQNPNEVYACSPSGGIWKSTTGGNNFTTTTDELASIGFSSIVVDYTNPNIVYAASGEGNGAVLIAYSLGVLKSTDGGLTWNQTGLNWQKKNVRQTFKIVMDPIDHNILLVTTNIGIFRTSDAGASWTLVKSGKTHDIEFQPGNSSVVYATSEQNFFRSTDNGITWTTITSGLPVPGDLNRLSIAVTPANSQYVYAIAGDDATSGLHGVYRSTDGGLTFTLRANQPNILSGSILGNDPGGLSWYTTTIAADPADPEHIFTGCINMWESVDGGQTFSLNAHWYDANYNYVHADIHFLEFIGNDIYVGSDGGFWKSTNGGASWTDNSGGLAITQFYRLATSELNTSLIFAGCQDNGSFRYNGTWTKVKGGDGMEQGINPLNTNIVYSESQNNGLSRSLNGGNSYTSITSGLSGTADWDTPFLLDNSGVLYVGRQDIFRSTNNGTNYTKITNGGMGVLKFMAICKNAQNVMYATNGTALYKIDLSTGNVTTVTGTFSGNISHVAVNDNDPNKVYVTISGFISGVKVFRSDNGGTSWTNISGNLPNVPAVSIAVQDDPEESIYVGTDMGVFYKNNNLSNWQPFMNGLPNVFVREMEINYSAGKLRAATYGRGIWESDLYTLTAPVADFTQDHTQICPGQTVTYTDISSDGPTYRTWTFPGGSPATDTSSSVTVTYANAGNYDVTLVSGNPAGTGDTTKLQIIKVGNNQQVLPLFEGFESGSLQPGWEVVTPGGEAFGWDLANVGAYGTSSNSYYCLNFDAMTTGASSEMHTQNYDLSSISTPNLTFDVAYAKRISSMNDTLKVQVSTDCGNTWTTIFSKGGNILKTTNTYYLSTPYVPAANEWRKEVVSLAAYANQPQVMFSFKNVTARGNNVYVDNINIDASAGIGENGGSAVNIRLYPNPVSEISMLTAGISGSKELRLEVYNVLGEKVKVINPQGGSSFEIRKADFGSGLFLYVLVNGRIELARGKFVVE